MVPTELVKTQRNGGQANAVPTLPGFQLSSPLKIDPGPSKQATGFLELSNASKDRPRPLEAGHRIFEIIESEKLT